MEDVFTCESVKSICDCIETLKTEVNKIIKQRNLALLRAQSAESRLGIKDLEEHHKFIHDSKDWQMHHTQ